MQTFATYVMAFCGIVFVLGLIVFLIGNFGTPSLDKRGPRGCGLMGIAGFIFLVTALILVFFGGSPKH